LSLPLPRREEEGRGRVSSIVLRIHLCRPWEEKKSTVKNGGRREVQKESLLLPRQGRGGKGGSVQLGSLFGEPRGGYWQEKGKKKTEDQDFKTNEEEGKSSCARHIRSESKEQSRRRKGKKKTEDGKLKSLGRGRKRDSNAGTSYCSLRNVGEMRSCEGERGKEDKSKSFHSS